MERMEETGSYRPRSGGALSLLAVAVAAAALGAGLVLAGNARAAAAAAAAAGASLTWAGLRAARSGRRRLLLLDALAERLVDAALLGAVAWASLPGEPRVAGAAVAAFGGAYLAAYVRARGTALGFRLDAEIGRRVDPALWFRALRPQLLAAGLLLGRVEAALWVTVAISAALVARTAAAVARQGEPG